MQKRLQSVALQGLSVFDTGLCHAYPTRYVSLIRHRVYVLLLPDAGVWVGTQTESSQPTRRERVGSAFYPILKAGVGAGWTFGIFSE